jgi:hypothetical protein
MYNRVVSEAKEILMLRPKWRSDALWILPAFVLWAGAGVLHAGILDPSEDFNNFGKQNQNFCQPAGVCAAASAINSFIFLENQYPGTYGTRLTPNVQGAKPNQTDLVDTQTFAAAYYSRTGDPFDDYVAVKTNWFNFYAPGTTVVTSNYTGSASNDGFPTVGFLTKEIQAQEDVELFVYAGDIGHAIVLTSISCSSPTDCVIKYQDPNSPTVQQTTQLFVGSTLTFQGLPGTGAQYNRTFFEIDAAFAESPVPEPSTWILLGTALVGLIGNRVRREWS